MVKFPQVLTKGLFPKGGPSHFRRALGSFPEGALVLGVRGGGGQGRRQPFWDAKELPHEAAQVKNQVPSWVLLGPLHPRLAVTAGWAHLPLPLHVRGAGPALSPLPGPLQTCEASSDYTLTPRSLFVAQQLTLPAANTDQHP